MRILQQSDPIYLDDQVTTQMGARLLIRLSDETELTLGEDAALVLDRFVYDPDAQTGSLVVRSLTGAFLFPLRIGRTLERGGGQD